MQLTVSLSIELPASGDVDSVEPMVLEAGRRAMVDALVAACGEYERQVADCPYCHSWLLQKDGTDRRVVLCSFGRVELHLKRLRCEGCGTRFRPADPFLACLEGASVTSQLREACVLAGSSWPYATAADVLEKLCGARVSAETVRRLTGEAGREEIARQVDEAEEVVSPTAASVRAEREKGPREPIEAKEEGREMLMVGLDGGWIPSREQRGGMEGKVGVVATEVEALGNGRHRLSRRRYVATFGDSQQLGVLAYGAAKELDGEDASNQVVLADGASWIKKETELHFPGAVRILDWPHLARAVDKAVRAVLPGSRNRVQRARAYDEVTGKLWRGQAEEALRSLVGLRAYAKDEPVSALEEAIRYIRGQRSWIGDYQQWRDEGYPIGSGLVERAVELVINRRLKGRGMRWMRPNANGQVALRVRTLNSHWDASSHSIAA